MNKKVVIMWIITAVCLVLAIVFWFLMNNTEISYEEVKATVTSTSSRTVVNKQTGSRTTFYEVKVEYEDKEYDLKNVHGLAGYSEGRTVKAYLANGNLYANVEGIKSTTPVAIVYFIFLFGTFIMFFVSVTYMSKVKQNSKSE